MAEHPNTWHPGDDYSVRFSDETALPRTAEQLDEMAERLRAVANEYGFDLSAWGSWQSLREIAVREHEAAQNAAIIVEKIATAISSVQPMPNTAIGDLRDALGEGGIPMSCESFTRRKS